MLEKFQDDIKNALRAKDAERLSVLRMVMAAFQSKQIEKRAKTGDQNVELTNDECIAVLKHEAKNRNDAIGQFAIAGRADLVEKEKNEFAIIQAYLPAELLDDELEIAVKEVIGGMGSVTEGDFGKIMGAVMKEIGGRASGDRVMLLVKKILQK